MILITTKKGTVGKGPEIVFEGQIGWESPSRKWDFMNAEEFLSFVRPAIAESYNGASVLTSATAAGSCWMPPPLNLQMPMAADSSRLL